MRQHSRHSPYSQVWSYCSQHDSWHWSRMESKTGSWGPVLPRTCRFCRSFRLNNHPRTQNNRCSCPMAYTYQNNLPGSRDICIRRPWQIFPPVHVPQPASGPISLSASITASVALSHLPWPNYKNSIESRSYNLPWGLHL